MALLYDKLKKNKKAIEYFDIYIKKVKDTFVGSSETKHYNYAESRRNRLREELHMKN